MTEIKVGNFVLQPAGAQELRLAMLLWGVAGCGKTTLASTAPGHKMWLQFDPDGTLSINNRSDVHVFDLSGDKHYIVERFKDDNPFGLERVLAEHPEIETVVFDSATAFAALATENAVHHVKSAKVEQPGLQGYGHRNALTLRAITSLMRLTKRMNRHFIIIAHEDTPDKNADGVVTQISVALGGKMTNQIGLQLSEVWWMQQTDKGERRIAVRPVRQRTPMKSRMFLPEPGEFVWRYNPETLEGETVDKWFKAWQDANGRKLPTPK